MASFLLYIIKSSFCLLAFYLGYKALLSNETFFRFNRKVLLGGMAACIILPLIEIETGSTGIIQQPFMELEKMIIWGEPIDLESFIVAESNPAEDKSISWGTILSGIYLMGGLCILLMLLHSAISLYLKVCGGRKIKSGNYMLVLLDEAITPFNWWKYIVLSETDYRNHSDEILTHERAHFDKHHSCDLLFFECVIILHWFNPASWLLKRELQDVHEYQADMEVLKSGIDATTYQLLLVKKAVNSNSYTFANSFNQSKLKKRITMMCKHKSNKWARWKLILLVPVAASAVYAFARPEVNNRLQQIMPNEVATIPPDEKAFTLDFFKSEFDSYLKTVMNKTTVSYEEKVGWVKKHPNKSILKINNLGVLLYNGKVVEKDQLANHIEKTLLDNTAKEPIVLMLQYDRETPPTLINNVSQTIGGIFSKNKQALKGKKQAALLFTYPPTYSDKVIVTLFDELQIASEAVIFQYDSMKTIRMKFKKLPNMRSEDLSVELKIDEGVQMGLIADIREALQEKYNPMRVIEDSSNRMGY